MHCVLFLDALYDRQYIAEFCTFLCVMENLNFCYDYYKMSWGSSDAFKRKASFLKNVWKKSDELL